MFARFLTPYEAERAERERIARKHPHLALVDYVPPAPKPAEPEMFVWKDVADLFGGSGAAIAAPVVQPIRAEQENGPTQEQPA